MTVAIGTLLLTASWMLYVWHNLYLATVRYHSLLLLVNLHHAHFYYLTWLRPFEQPLGCFCLAKVCVHNLKSSALINKVRLQFINQDYKI